MKSMTVFVHVPTQPDPLPTAVIHACGLGCAIVGARIGGIPEILDQGNAGQLVMPNDPIRLSNMLNKLVSDTTQLANLRAEARKQFLKTFTLEQMQSRLERAYQMVLKQ
jgi:glycosyltransferase involved in cell wall biosynthesis